MRILKAIVGLVSLSFLKCSCNQTGHGGYPLFSKPSLLYTKGSGFKHRDLCDDVRLDGKKGIITSPAYPSPYKNRTSCTWTILADPGEVIIISFDDLDIEESPSKTCSNVFESPVDENGLGELRMEPCCTSNWVKVSRTDGENEVKYCGRSEDGKSIPMSYIDSSGQVTIKFHSFWRRRGGRGFHLSYMITQTQSMCKEDEFKCANGRCILNKWRCNRRNECGDESDEISCDDMCASVNEIRCSEDHDVPGCYLFPTQKCNGVWDCKNGNDEKGCEGCPSDMYRCSKGLVCYTEARRCDGVVDCPSYDDELDCGLCGPNRTQCSPTSVAECFDPFTQRCNRQLDCKNGNDEKSCTQNCRNKILCSSGNGCYSPEERCNGLPNCKDGSDERNCSTELCRPEQGNFLCNNGRCIRKAWTCDRSDHCGDSSDESSEANCLKNSVITAALMGSLICGLLLVIAISCTCKLIALRQVEQRQELGDSHSHPANVCQAHPHLRCYPAREAQLFGLDHEYFYREPPPSYSASVEHSEGGDLAQQRRRRRDRRQRRRPLILSVHTDSEPVENNTSPSYSVGSNATSRSVQETPTVSAANKSSEDEEGKPNGAADESGANQPTPTLTAINIELDHMASCESTNCDRQPLLS